MAGQRLLANLTAPLWLPAVYALLKLGMGYRICGSPELRAEFRAVWGKTPLLICANHLTLADPALVLLALGGLRWFFRHPGAVPWTVLAVENVPRIFPGALKPLHYLLKCIPIPRGRSARETGATLGTVRDVLTMRDCVVIFPEGRRARNGRVDPAVRTYGAGRLLARAPTCRVLCLYIRGRGQETWSDLPRRGERFDVRHRWLEPGTTARGLRGSLDLTNQIMTALAGLERCHLDQTPRAAAGRER